MSAHGWSSGGASSCRRDLGFDAPLHAAALPWSRRRPRIRWNVACSRALASVVGQHQTLCKPGGFKEARPADPLPLRDSNRGGEKRKQKIFFLRRVGSHQHPHANWERKASCCCSSSLLLHPLPAWHACAWSHNGFGVLRFILMQGQPSPGQASGASRCRWGKS